MTASTHPLHPLDRLCLCGHAAWLHTTRCVAQRPSCTSQMQFTACGCVRTAGSFA